MEKNLVDIATDDGNIRAAVGQSKGKWIAYASMDHGQAVTSEGTTRQAAVDELMKEIEDYGRQAGADTTSLMLIVPNYPIMMSSESPQKTMQNCFHRRIHGFPIGETNGTGQPSVLQTMSFGLMMIRRFM